MEYKECEHCCLYHDHDIDCPERQWVFTDNNSIRIGRLNLSGEGCCWNINELGFSFGLFFPGVTVSLSLILFKIEVSFWGDM